MSSAESASGEIRPELIEAPRGDAPRRSFDAWLQRASEYLNPILVKEARQDLKSRQFSLTFALLLVAGWCWSLFCIVSLAPAIYFAPSGSYLLFGYFFILSIPMMVIIPFSAFRSLAVEREDGTFELLSITTLGARQIVTGKLGSAVLQMIVYYSALAPCLAFTYLLRGIDIPTILFILVWTFFVSIALATLGLLFATITRARHWQSVLAVMVILGLALATFLWNVMIYGMVFEGGMIAFDDEEFLFVMLGLFIGLISFSILFLLAAASRISFASDNASTRLRVMMLIQQVLFCGWIVLIAIGHDASDSFMVTAVCGSLYWGIAGAIMVGESSKMSPRVLRQLPQSFAGRMFLTWFFPGSGTGYFFAIGNLLTLIITVGFTPFIHRAMFGDFTIAVRMNYVWFAIMAWIYVALYLGTGRLLYVGARRYNPDSLLLAFLLNFFLVILGAAVPWLMQGWLTRFTSPEYTPLQFTNWAWTLTEIERLGLSASTEASMWLASFFLVIVICLNFYTTVEEIDQIHQATPQRILEDELAMHPEKAERSKRLSPWDEEPPRDA